MKTEACKLYSRVFWIILPNFIKIAPCNFELYRFKVKTFFWDTVYILCTNILWAQNTSMSMTTVVLWPQWQWMWTMLYLSMPKTVNLSGKLWLPNWTLCIPATSLLLLLLHSFNGHFSRTTWVSRHQRSITILVKPISGFTGARDSEWQWHQLGDM